MSSTKQSEQHLPQSQRRAVAALCMARFATKTKAAKGAGS